MISEKHIETKKEWEKEREKHPPVKGCPPNFARGTDETWKGDGSKVTDKKVWGETK